MIDLAFVERLIRALDESGLDNLELERGGTRLRLSKSPYGHHAATPVLGGTVNPHSAPVLSAGNDGAALSTGPGSETPATPGVEGAPEDHGFLEVTSPMVGTFYASPAPDAAPYVTVGQSVGKGTVLCIIEAMKLMNELESEVEGTVVRVLVENAQPVEYGQVLFLIDPA